MTTQAPVAPAPSPAQPTTPSGDAKVKVKTQIPAKPESSKTSDAPKTTPSSTDGMTPEQKKLWKMNVFGKEVDFDASNEEDLKKAVQRGLAADIKFQEASEVDKKMRQFIQLLKTSPEKVLLNPSLGHNPEALIERLVDVLGPKARPIIEKRMSQWVDEEMMDPKDREILEHKRRLQEMEEQRRTEREAIDNERMQSLVSHYNEQYSRDIVETLKNSGLPQSPHTVKRMAFYLYQLLDRGVEAKAADVVDLVKQDYIVEQKELFGGLDGEALLSILGTDLADKVVKAATDAMKNGRMKPVPKSEQPPYSSPSPKKKYITSDEFREKFGA